LGGLKLGAIRADTVVGMKKAVASVVVVVALAAAGSASAGWSNGWYQTKKNIQYAIAHKWNMNHVYCEHGDTAEKIIVSQNVWWSWFACLGFDNATGKGYVFRALITGPNLKNFQIARLKELPSR
jgi:hypothetical protein